MIPTPRLLILALAAGLGATACATPTEPTSGTPIAGKPGAPSNPAPGDPAPKPPRYPEPAPGEPVMECNAQPARWAVGKLADAALVERVRTDTNSERARVLKPGQMVTMEFRGDRVNIDVDNSNVVTNIRCG